MNKERKGLIVVAAIICIVSCFADNIITFILAEKYPGYNHLTNTLSKLGESASPVSRFISGWWILLGILFTFFAVGFYFSFKHKGKPAIIATLLIIIYALGEGIGSGLFPANYIKHGLTFSLIIHDAFSGIGMAGIIILPLFMVQLFPKEKFQCFYLLSIAVTVTGLSMFILFSVAKIFNNPDYVLLSFKGLWQRIINANYYLYLIVIAVMMIQKSPGNQ